MTGSGGGGSARVVLAEPGPVLHVLAHGATVQRLEVTCGDGVRRNVVLGHATPADYLASSDYVGGSIGRYANRIAGGRFDLDGREVVVGTHDRGHHLHGGPDGFDRRTWEVVEQTGTSITLRVVSPDGDQGFPGEVAATVTFVVDGDSPHHPGWPSATLRPGETYEAWLAWTSSSYDGE